MLKECLNLPQLRSALKDVPATLDGTYDRILASIPAQHKSLAIRILQLLTYSRRPPMLEEIIDAIAVFPDEKPCFDSSWRMPDPSEITRLCSSPVSKVDNQKVLKATLTYPYHSDRCCSILQLAHFSVKEYLVSDRVEERPRSRLVENNAHKELTQVCTAYLTHAFEVNTRWQEVSLGKGVGLPRISLLC